MLSLLHTTIRRGPLPLSRHPSAGVWLSFESRHIPGASWISSRNHAFRHMPASYYFPHPVQVHLGPLPRFLFPPGLLSSLTPRSESAPSLSTREQTFLPRGFSPSNSVFQTCPSSILTYLPLLGSLWLKPTPSVPENCLGPRVSAVLHRQRAIFTHYKERGVESGPPAGQELL